MLDRSFPLAPPAFIRNGLAGQTTNMEEIGVINAIKVSGGKKVIFSYRK